jgi:hypothetical protein
VGGWGRGGGWGEEEGDGGRGGGGCAGDAFTVSLSVVFADALLETFLPTAFY